MGKCRGFTLLELLLSTTLSLLVITALLGFFGQACHYWQQSSQALQNYQELCFILDNIRETVHSGTVQESSAEDTLIVKDKAGRYISFYLKNSKVCMYKNSVFYLSTEATPIQTLSFNYDPSQKPLSVDISFLSGQEFIIFI